MRRRIEVASHYLEKWEMFADLNANKRQPALVFTYRSARPIVGYVF
jgi:hypothetical protein